MRNSNYVSKILVESAKSDADLVLNSLKTSTQGLPDEEVEERIEKYGKNEFVTSARQNIFTYLVKSFTDPLIILLFLIAIVSYFTHDINAVVVISVMVVVSISLKVFQEERARASAEKLKAMVKTTATVIRQGKKKEIPLSYIVPGEIIQLAAGDMVPADVRIISSKDLFVNQAVLTGESIPVDKHSRLIANNSNNPFEYSNLCFMGTNVQSGTAIVVAVLTGKRTYFGSLTSSLNKNNVLSSFDKGIMDFTWLMIKFIIIIVAVIFLINGVLKRNWVEAFLFASAVAIGLTPEMLPMIVTVNLSKGAMVMSRKKVIVKRLSAIQNFGAMNILCTDKTGTITQGRIILEKIIDIYGNEENEHVLQYAYLNSHFQTSLRSIMDETILNHGHIHAQLNIESDYKKIDEVAFDFVRKRMSVAVEDKSGKHIIICKGAVEEMLKVCKYAQANSEILQIDNAFKMRISKIVSKLNKDGFMVVAVAYKETEGDQTVYTSQDENDLTLMGFIGFLDPPKDSTLKALELLKDNGVQVKILTGDSEIVTKKICKEVKLRVTGTLLGHELESMPQEELESKVENTTIFAKLLPEHKERIIKALQKKGHTVGFLGDGINDTAALRAADVGISVDTAVDVAKEYSSIVLMEKSLIVLRDGVIEGRKVFGNTLKYIRMAASSNFGNIISLVGASLFLPFLPMLPIQILVNNMLYDFSQVAIPTDNVDEEYLAKPRQWRISDIKKFIFYIGPISSIFDYATFFLMIYVFNAYSNPSLFQTGWFIESLATQTMIIHIIRTNRIPFLQSRASITVILSSILIVSLGIWLPFSPFASSLKFTQLPHLYWIFLILILVSYITLTHYVKTWLLRKYFIE